jgi:hypothetical protein
MYDLEKGDRQTTRSAFALRVAEYRNLFMLYIQHPYVIQSASAPPLAKSRQGELHDGDAMLF